MKVFRGNGRGAALKKCRKLLCQWGNFAGITIGKRHTFTLQIKLVVTSLVAELTMKIKRTQIKILEIKIMKIKIMKMI